MTDIQEIRVEEHIHGLQREAAEVRAERARNARLAPSGVAFASRQRVGRWLIAFGRAVAGGAADPVGDSTKRAARAA